jgi:large subunit ribosomal protein L35
MPKLKTSKSILKRVKVTSNGKILRHKASRSHLLEKKAQKRKKNLGKIVTLDKRDLNGISLKLPYLHICRR